MIVTVIVTSGAALTGVDPTMAMAAITHTSTRTAVSFFTVRFPSPVQPEATLKRDRATRSGARAGQCSPLNRWTRASLTAKSRRTDLARGATRTAQGPGRRLGVGIRGNLARSGSEHLRVAT